MMLALALPLSAQEPPAPSPNEIVARASPDEWVSIAPEDLLVMTLAPDAEGRERQVVIQLMPPPFSQGWVENIRTLARAGWYDGLSINRVQDNYVVQWGDPDGEDAARAKKLPEELKKEVVYDVMLPPHNLLERPSFDSSGQLIGSARQSEDPRDWVASSYGPYGSDFIDDGWPQAHNGDRRWPVHCYGMVGVGRGLLPDTGSGAELYTVIGHAPRHLDRNIALVGRVAEGIEHLSSLPRGTGDLGFYETAEERVPIRSVRVASELPENEQPEFQYLSTESETFARYAEARANRRDPFFIQPAGGADICNIPVPVRRTP
jgi:peptidylprolyl isomerase